MPTPDKQELHYAQQAINRFARRFQQPDYRKLVYYAALPLVLTPQLLHYLRTHFLRPTGLPWVAEVDLLLSDLCRPAGYERYVMDTAVRACALDAMRRELGPQAMQQVAWLLLEYLKELARRTPRSRRQELRDQQWAAMLYLPDRCDEAVQQIAQHFQALMQPLAAGQSGALADLRGLSRLVQALGPEMSRYPALQAYARDVALRNPRAVPPDQWQRPRTVAGVELDLQALRPEDAPQEQTLTIKGVAFELVWIPAGSFMMGQTEADKAYLLQTIGKEMYERSYQKELPRHRVAIRQGFWMGKYPVTQEQWQAVMGENPSSFNAERVGRESARHPVEKVSWNECQEFLWRLNEFSSQPSPTGGEGTPAPPQQGGERTPPPAPPRQGGERFRLPSEAEWEYACRAGTDTIWFYGNDEAELQHYAWYSKNSDGQTHPVGQLRPNAWGLYDMHGNVWEWCADAWHDNYETAPKDECVWENKGENKAKALRGGSWYDVPSSARCADRNWNHPGNGNYGWGLRVVAVFSSRTL